MKQVFWVVFCLVCLGCKPRNFESNASSSNTVNVESCFRQGATPSAKVDCLNKWIQNTAMPKAAADVASLSAPAVSLNDYSVSVCGGHYFNTRPKWIPPQADLLGVWTELETNRQRDLFLAQIESAVAFLKKVHKAMQGIPNGWFKEVVVCPRKMLANTTKPPLQLMSGTLYVWTREQAGGYQVLREDELMQRWNAMDFESDLHDTAKSLNSRFNNRAQKAWGILNPVSTIRTAARTLVFDKLKMFMAQLNALTSTNGDAHNLTSSTSTELNNILQSMARESAQATFAQRLLEQPIDEKDVHCIANLLKKKLATSSLWQQEQSCTNTVLARQIRNSVSVQDVGVYVGNLHSIAVGISTCEPTMESHSLSEKDVLEQNVSIRRVGVAVHTVDDIRVALNAFVFPSIAEQVVAQLRQCQSP